MPFVVVGFDKESKFEISKNLEKASLNISTENVPNLFNENHVLKIINTWLNKENIALNLDKSGFLF